MIVNGSDAFVGSDQDHLQKDLNNELSMPASVALRMSLKKQDAQVIINYQVQGFSNGDVINFALVERRLVTDVAAGENAGRTLHHDNVVKEFKTLRLKDNADQVIIPLDKVSDTSEASVIAFVQNPQTMLIEDAKQLDIEHD